MKRHFARAKLSKTGTPYEDSLLDVIRCLATLMRKD